MKSVTVESETTICGQSAVLRFFLHLFESITTNFVVIEFDSPQILQ